MPPLFIWPAEAVSLRHKIWFINENTDENDDLKIGLCSSVPMSKF